MKKWINGGLFIFLMLVGFGDVIAGRHEETKRGKVRPTRAIRRSDSFSSGSSGEGSPRSPGGWLEGFSKELESPYSSNESSCDSCASRESGEGEQEDFSCMTIEPETRFVNYILEASVSRKKDSAIAKKLKIFFQQNELNVDEPLFREGKTALMVAAENNLYEIAMVLLDAGADAEVVLEKINDAKEELDKKMLQLLFSAQGGVNVDELGSLFALFVTTDGRQSPETGTPTAATPQSF